ATVREGGGGRPLCRVRGYAVNRIPGDRGIAVGEGRDSDGSRVRRRCCGRAEWIARAEKSGCEVAGHNRPRHVVAHPEVARLIEVEGHGGRFPSHYARCL